MAKTDVLIVGQGIAGTCLAFELLRRGQTVRIIDDGHSTAASLVGTAIINPVTGRRYAKSWNIDELLPVSRSFYSDVEEVVGDRFLGESEILQIIPDERIEEIWMVRSGDPEFEPYLDPDLHSLTADGIAKVSSGRIKNVLSLQISKLIRLSEASFKDIGIQTTDDFRFDDLRIMKDRLEYGLEQYEHVIFCEGYRTVRNPYFDWLEIYPMKGEFLIVDIPGLDLECHIKSNISLVPLGENQYWCGSTYDRYNDDPVPSSEASEYLSSQLSKIVTIPFEIVQHGTGIRCTTRDRRPYVGTHPEHRGLHVVTGLGTKGASLSPYCAKVLADRILNGTDIPSEVDILRHVRS